MDKMDKTGQNWTKLTRLDKRANIRQYGQNYTLWDNMDKLGQNELNCPTRTKLGKIN